MSVSATSSVAAYLQQRSEIRQQQNQVDAEVAESTRRARQQVVDQNLQDSTLQAERVNEIKKAALEMRGSGGGIDVWA